MSGIVETIQIGFVQPLFSMYNKYTCAINTVLHELC